MKEKKENAFPALHLDGHRGMTLRDYFASKVLNGKMSTEKYSSDKDIAKYCYELADAMLKQREL